MKPPGTTRLPGGLFPHPPHPTVFWQQPNWALYRDLLSVQVRGNCDNSQADNTAVGMGCLCIHSLSANWPVICW